MSVILSIYPNVRGLGYVCLQFPGTVYDFAMVGIRRADSDQALERVKRLILVLRPTIIVLRSNAPVTGKGRRVAELIARIERYALAAGIPVHSYSRAQVKDVFEIFGAKNRQEIAEWLGYHFPALSENVPKPRKFYEDEDYNMGIFDAMALAVTYQYLTE